MKENQIRSCFQPPFSRPPRLIPRLIPLLLTAAGLLFSPGPLPGPAADEPPAPSLTQPLPLSPEETAWVQENPQVTVSLLSSWAPFEYLNDREEPAGYSVDYVKILCRKLGLTPRFLQDLSWQEYMDRFRRGKLDILSSMVKTPERSEYTLFTEIYYTSRPGLAVTKSPRAAPLSMEDLTQRPPGSPPVTFPAGFYYQEYFDTHHPQTSYQTVPTTRDALKKVLFGESFAALGDRPVLEHLIQHHQLQSLQVVPLLQASQFSTPLRLGVHRSNPQLAELLRRAARAVTPQEKALLKARWMESRRGTSAPRLTLDEQLYLDQQEELTLVTDPGWTPLAFINGRGEHAGIADEYLDLISRRLGIPIRLLPTESWQESWDLVRQGKADLVSALMDTPERREFCLFTQPYLEDPFVITVREGAPFAASIRDIADKKIGVVDDYATEQILRENYPELQLVKVPSIQEGLSRVSSREIYAFVDSLATVSYELGRQRRLDLKIAGQLPEQWTISFGVNPEKEILVPILNKALDTITPEEKQNIWEKWLRINFDHTVNQTLLRNLLLGAAAAAFLGLWRYLLVRKKNAQLRDLNCRLEHLSITDPLTQLYNRLKMDRVLQDETARAARSGRPYCLLILDIDHFKEVNDQHGHDAGDRVLVRTAQTLRNSIREVDVLGRWGGEEFLILCPETSLASAEVLAERLRRALEEAGEPRVTASFGGAVWHAGEEPSQVLSRADKNLYAAKEAGRNQVCLDP